jgi:sugar phosphate isomerase/epimerase
MTSQLTVGTTSYGFRYQLRDARSAPSLAALVRQTRAAGLDALQICENARPLESGTDAWREALRAADQEAVALHVGCMTLDLDVLGRYLDLAASVPGASALRIVLEDETGEAPSRDRLAHFVEQAAARARTAGLRLVIENHFHIACRTLVELAADYPPDLVAFCVDSANSLRNWESPFAVFELLEPRAAFYHLKDFRVRGSNVGFEVSGAPLGEGLLDLAWCVHRMQARHARPLVFLENWVPDTGDAAADASNDAVWLARAHSALRLAVQSSGPVRAEGR